MFKGGHWFETEEVPSPLNSELYELAKRAWHAAVEITTLDQQRSCCSENCQGQAKTIETPSKEQLEEWPTDDERKSTGPSGKTIKEYTGRDPEPQNDLESTGWIDVCRSVWDLYDELLAFNVGMEGPELTNATFGIICKCIKSSAIELQSIGDKFGSKNHTCNRPSACAHAYLFRMVSDTCAQYQAGVPMGRAEFLNTIVDAGDVGYSSKYKRCINIYGGIIPSLQDLQRLPDKCPTHVSDNTHRSQRGCSENINPEASDASDRHSKDARYVHDAEECGIEASQRGGGDSKDEVNTARDNGYCDGSDMRSHDSNGYGVGCGVTSGSIRGEVTENVQLHQERSSEVVGFTGPNEFTQVTRIGLGDDRKCMFPTFSRSISPDTLERIYQNAINNVTSYDVPDNEEVNDETPVAETNVANSNTQELCAQRSEITDGQSSSKSARAQSGDDDVATESVSQSRQVGSTTHVVPRFSEINTRFSPEQKKALSQGKRIFVEFIIDGEGCVDKIFCQVRKAKDFRQGRGPENDSGEKSKIQPRIRDVYEGNRTPTISVEGSSNVGTPDKPKTRSKRKKSGGKGSRSKAVVGSNGESSEHITGLEQVGYARQCGDDQSNASDVSHSNVSSLVGSSTGKTVAKSSSDSERSEIQGGRRSHEWRYDDSTGELHCSYCNSADLPRYTLIRCRKHRISKIKRDRAIDRMYRKGPITYMYTAAQAAVTYGSPKVSDVDVRRRRRSCTNSGEGSGKSCVRSPSHVLGRPRARIESGGKSTRISSNCVLPTQTPLNARRMGDDARSGKSAGHFYGNNRAIHRQSEEVFVNDMAGQIPIALESTDTRPLFQTPEAAVGGDGGNVPKGEGESAQRNRHPVIALIKERARARRERDAARAKSDGMAPVANRAGYASALRTGKVSNSPQVKEAVNGTSIEKSGRVKSGANIRRLIPVRGSAVNPRECTLMHCVGADLTLGKGVALDLKLAYGRPMRPDAWRSKTDMEIVGKSLRQVVGEGDDKFTIYHMITKSQSKVPALKTRDPYGVLEKCVDSVFKDLKYKCIACPGLIGCGLDRLEPSRVKDILTRAAERHDKYVYIYYPRK